MSNRPEPLSAAEQADIGRVALAMREARVCWKRIEDELGMSRVQLWRCLSLVANETKNPGMKHRRGCQAA